MKNLRRKSRCLANRTNITNELYELDLPEGNMTAQHIVKLLWALQTNDLLKILVWKSVIYAEIRYSGAASIISMIMPFGTFSRIHANHYSVSLENVATFEPDKI